MIYQFIPVAPVRVMERLIRSMGPGTMAVLEAAAHRIPVVQTDECNFPELAAAGGAWECRPERVSVEETLRSALSAEDAERAERGSRGRELVEKSYSWDQIAEQVLAACRERVSV